MSKFLELVEQHEAYRKRSINLQASENIMSPDALKCLGTDMASRYSLYEPTIDSDAYGGTRYSEDVLHETEKLSREVFGTKYTEVRPLGGHIAAQMVLLSIVKKKENILSISESDGGYTGYQSGFMPEMFCFQNYRIPYNKEEQEIDLEKLQKVMKSTKPKLIMLGQSFFLKPYNLKMVREIADENDSHVAYDASHVLGLVGGKAFQEDIAKYSDIFFGSTHKTFFGPQGGLIFTNNEDIYIKIEKNVTWRTMDNYHISRVASIGTALEEMKAFGKDYAHAVVENSQKLGKSLHERGFPVLYDPWFSFSHQIHIGKKEKNNPQEFLQMSKRLEENGIIIDREGRIGTAEITRMGLYDMEILADLIVKAFEGEKVRKDVESIALNLRMRYWKGYV
ncbi:beta-eliminating lyase-related protein [Oxyplasma meridianum]|uniref:Beta-eliminating lyase-related protein n=2 Tax=Oxyplasma meridianum TaxID=3073602 RepID=A0AAX4NH48_9ARCH